LDVAGIKLIVRWYSVFFIDFVVDFFLQPGNDDPFDEDPVEEANDD
jgi:hypothetical protein